ncbi:MAG: hypothetical protein AAB459_03060 [Patescibacteria group bacterium]
MTSQTPQQHESLQNFIGLYEQDPSLHEPLPDTMSPFELEMTLSHCTNEYRCLVTGLLSETPKSINELHSKIEETGATKLEPLNIHVLRRQLRNFFSPAALNFATQDTGSSSQSTSREFVWLTPYGILLRSISGQMLTRIAGAPMHLRLEDVIGKRNHVVPNDENENSYTHIKRLAIMSMLASQTGSFDREKVSNLVGGFEIERNMIEGQLKSLVSTGFLTLTKRGPKNIRYWQATQLLRDVTAQFQELIDGYRNRDPIILQDGHERMDSALISADIPYQIRRAFGPIDEQRFPRMFEAHDLATRALRQLNNASGSTGISEIYDVAQTLGYLGNIGNFRSNLVSATKRIPDSAIELASPTVRGTDSKWRLRSTPRNSIIN